MFLFVVFSPLSFFFLSFLFVFFSLPVRLCDVPCWNKCVVLWQELVSLKAAERLSSLTVALTPRTDSQAVSPRPETRAGTRPASSHSLYTSATSNSIVSHCNRLIRVLQAHSWGRILWAARRTCIQPAQRAVRLNTVWRECVCLRQYAYTSFCQCCSVCDSRHCQLDIVLRLWWEHLDTATPTFIRNS